MVRRCVVPSLLLVLVIACASATSPADNAERAYGQAAIAYSTAQSAIVDLRADHRVTDLQWSEFDAAQHVIAGTAPLVSGLLRDWKAGGVKPASYDATLQRLLDAFNAVNAVYTKVKP